MLYSPLASALAALSLLSPTLAAINGLRSITNFGENPSGAGFFLYVPPNVQANPPILVEPHWCHGDANEAFRLHTFANLADTYGYVVIYPDSPHTSDKCWDVSSAETLSHDGGGDSRGIVSMVEWTIKNYNADASRVYAMGASSGGMMVNVLLGSYPDVFTAGSVWAGVPFGCFAGAGPDFGSQECADGRIVKTGAEWAALVHAAFPTYTGPRPSVQVFHGTADIDLVPQVLNEEIKQWTAVLGLPSTPVQSVPDTPVPGWTKMDYGHKFQAYSAAGADHLIPIQEQYIIEYFNLTVPGSPTKESSAAVTVTPVPANVPVNDPSPVPQPAAGTIAQWGQCGGLGWIGTETCVAGTTCTSITQYWSQCI